jgi:hypothetical protein
MVASMSNVSREELHRMVDTMPAAELEAAKRELELHCIPYDDEPETPEEAAAVAEARAEPGWVPLEAVERTLGLTPWSAASS